MKSHTGWAAVVAVAGPAESAEVVARRRIDMATTFAEGAVYHAGQNLDVRRAEALILSSEEKFERTARDALLDLANALRNAGCQPVAAGVLAGSGKPLPPLPSILKSHALVHAAEGELYRRVLIRATEGCQIPPLRVPEKEIEMRAAAALGIVPARLSAWLLALGKVAGKPWTKDHKQAAMAAWIALASREPGPARERGPTENGPAKRSVLRETAL